MITQASVVAVSPHLDDAILSIGGLLADSARSGTPVEVLTVFGNDPRSTLPPGEWDAACGFSSVGEAARARRVEDVRACARIGATSAVLDFGAEEYGHGASADEVRTAVLNRIDGAETVLLPGFPLLNPDHAEITQWLLDDLGSRDVGLYVEQPYACSLLMGRSRRRGHELSLRQGIQELAKSPYSGGLAGVLVSSRHAMRGTRRGA